MEDYQVLARYCTLSMLEELLAEWDGIATDSQAADRYPEIKQIKLAIKEIEG